ncbi:LysE family translocator [Falsiroseomonas selenitidurans]|uniref:LysE family translocator n=1 Tax=Falsiroseomonas selenitidurans TaxID=2716335 RepID=A0ABX1E119_9PROT|nr:LysE family translocator [Falsiroseomonas selenitidurans]NKC29457.1 LysE family translocator [Falsiroseomonas selenitidurans]
MPDLTQLALYFAAALLLAVTPGPGLFYVAARSLAGGRAEGVASSFGTGLGGMVHVLAGSLGVSAVLLASAELFTILKLAGAAYLVWLGFRTLQAARRDRAPDLGAGLAQPPIGSGRAFREGVLVEALNPKTAAFFLAFVPQFLDPAAGPVAWPFVALGFISVALNTLADIVVAFAASRIRDGAAARPGLIRRLRLGSGGAMVALGLGLALARRPAG